jgi:hypothetical protein
MNETVRGILAALPSRLRSPYVFPSAAGDTPLDSQNLVNRVFVKALRKAEIEDFTWHLRHSFASRSSRRAISSTPSGASTRPQPAPLPAPRSTTRKRR